MQKVQECIPYIFSSAKNVNKKLILAGCERNDGQTNLAERNVKEIGGGGEGNLRVITGWCLSQNRPEDETGRLRGDRGLTRDGICPKIVLKTVPGDRVEGEGTLELSRDGVCPKTVLKTGLGD